MPLNIKGAMLLSIFDVDIKWGILFYDSAINIRRYKGIKKDLIFEISVAFLESFEIKVSRNERIIFYGEYIKEEYTEGEYRDKIIEHIEKSLTLECLSLYKNSDLGLDKHIFPELQEDLKGIKRKG